LSKRGVRGQTRRAFGKVKGFDEEGREERVVSKFVCMIKG